MASRFSHPARGDDEAWFRVGSVDVTTSVLVPALCVLSMIVWAASPSLLTPLVLQPTDVVHGQVWRLVTWPLANGPDLWTVIGLAMLWYFGRELERMVGRGRFMWLLVLLAAVPGVVATLVDLELFGVRSLELAVLCLFCAQLPQARFWGSIPAWVFAAVIVGIEVLVDAGSRQGGQLLVLIASLLTAALAGRAFGLLTDYPWLPHLGRRTARRPSKPARRARRAADTPTVVQGPWQQAGLSAAEQHELDALLDKTSAGGLDSLSRPEKDRLNELSKKLRAR